MSTTKLQSTRAAWLLMLCWAAGCTSDEQTKLSAAQAADSAAHGAPEGTTRGYVLSSYLYAFYMTKGAREECPHGFVHTNRESWEVQFPTHALRQAQLDRCGSLTNRGPNCENVWATPDVIEDPLPFRSVEGKISFGVNLDGTPDGRATERTCAHEKFVSPEGEPGIDNQYYRFIGCERFVQGGQHHADQNSKVRVSQYHINRVLLEISGVDDEQNDEHVNVTLYRGKDRLLVDASDNAVPWQSQTIDTTIPPVDLKGRITAGELITEPADVIWEGIAFERRMLIRGMSLRLKLNGLKAEGMRVGYVDVDQLWQSYAHTAKWGGNIYGASAPAAYEAMHRLADGYKDPETGACTGLSSARKVEFVRAYVIRPASETHAEPQS